MSHETGTRAGKRKLAYMANQIAAFFEAMPHEEAVAGVARHINDFWEPRMRRQFFEIVEEGGDELKPLVREAAEHVRRPPAVQQPAARA